MIHKTYDWLYASIQFRENIKPDAPLPFGGNQVWVFASHESSLNFTDVLLKIIYYIGRWFSYIDIPIMVALIIFNEKSGNMFKMSWLFTVRLL